MNTIHIWRASTDEDVRLVADMWIRCARRLADAGSDQWQYPLKTGNLEAAVSARSCWIASAPEGDLIGTITVDGIADPNLWQRSDRPDDALYLHRMITEPQHAGKAIGSALMDWAARRSAGYGRSWIRLDAWRTNTGLRDYYLRHAFDLVRTVKDPTGTGLCFQRPARFQLHRGPTVRETVTPATRPLRAS